ncbi:hypothetical protein [Enterobacter sp.]|uniref:hypothetical protein n=1 Tax=Enterobacter sp. TaxID=42895 RepID=UPI00296FD383|nr:hypothetical protein [Enterobacter sp.]
MKPKARGFIESHKGRILIGGLLLFVCAMFSVMTIAFIYSNDKVRQEYRQIADKRDRKVEKLAEQVGTMQQKLDAMPEKTAEKTADKVKTVVKEDENK